VRGRRRLPGHADDEGIDRGRLREGDRGTRPRSAEGHGPRDRPRRRHRAGRGQGPADEVTAMEGHDPAGRERSRCAVRPGARPGRVRNRSGTRRGDVPPRRARRGNVASVRGKPAKRGPYALRCLPRRIASATAADAAITRTPQTTRTVRSSEDEAGWIVGLGLRTVIIGRTFSADAPYASVTVTVGVYVPALEYEWLA